jgi:hypothetical protein
MEKQDTECPDSLYSLRKAEYLTKLEYEIKTAVRDIERLQKRYDNWKLVEVTP